MAFRNQILTHPRYIAFPGALTVRAARPESVAVMATKETLSWCAISKIHDVTSPQHGSTSHQKLHKGTFAMHRASYLRHDILRGWWDIIFEI